MEEWLAEQQRSSGDGVEPIEELLGRSVSDLSSFLGRYQSCGAFKRMAWDPAQEYMLQPPHYPESQWAHLKQNGFEGAFLEYTPGTPIFKEWDLLAGLLGSVIKGGRQVATSRL